MIFSLLKIHTQHSKKPSPLPAGAFCFLFLFFAQVQRKLRHWCRGESSAWRCTDKGRYSLSRKRVSPLLRTLRHAGNKVQSTALPKIPPFSKEKRTPLPRRSSYFCESKIYRYFCMPSVARAGSPETEMVNLTPVALLKRSSSFRKSSAAWLHSPPVILNRLSMKMWEIS